MIVVGNLLTDPAAQSFISLVDADDYLAIEQNNDWNLARPEAKEAALVRASRWLAQAFLWRPLLPGDLVAVGRIAARLAGESLAVPLFAGTDVTKAIKRAKAGSAEVEYQSAMTADAAGMRWPWLRSMLWGLATPVGAGSARTVRVIRA